MKKILSLLILFSTALQAHWVHLELGAGNYGGKRNPKDRPLDEVLASPEYATLGNNSVLIHQYGVLFWTLDELVSRYGEEGTFFLNDYVEEGAYFAADKLQAYADAMRYDQVEIKTIVGNYRTLDFLSYLEDDKPLFDSVHIKNTETNFYRVHHESREKTREFLQSMANISEEGLLFFTVYTNIFFPLPERVEFVDQGLFYLQPESWEPVPYVYKNLSILKGEMRVFHIAPTN